MKKLISELSSESKQVLNLLASETSKILLNKHVISQTLSVNELVYIPDLLKAKKSHSLIDSLARVVKTKEGRNYELQLLNKKIIT